MHFTCVPPLHLPPATPHLTPPQPFTAPPHHALHGLCTPPYADAEAAMALAPGQPKLVVRKAVALSGMGQHR